MDIEKVSIHQIIAHKVNHLDGKTGLQFSGLDLDVIEHMDVAELLKEHLVTSCNHRYISKAHFISREEWLVRNNQSTVPIEYLKEICDDLLNNPNLFIKKSQEIAKHLYDMIEGKKHISQGDLVICTFKEEPNNELKLALLKMDIKKVFLEETVQVGPDIQIILKPHEGFATGVLQKCAFILPQSLREKSNYDLKVLDFQQKFTGVNNPVATFFSDDFLQCKVEFTDEQLTRKFLKEVEQYANKMKKKWRGRQRDRFKKGIMRSLKKKEVDIVDFAKNINDSDQRTEFLDKMAVKMPTMVFKPDAILRMQLKEKTIFEGDNGLRVEINSDAIGPGKTLEDQGIDEFELHRIVLSTSIWSKKQIIKKEVKKDDDSKQVIKGDKRSRDKKDASKLMDIGK